MKPSGCVGALPLIPVGFPLVNGVAPMMLLIPVKFVRLSRLNDSNVNSTYLASAILNRLANRRST